MRLASLLLLLAAAPAVALQQDVPFHEMAARATLVVVGEVTTVEPRWAPGPRGHIETHVWLAAEQVLHGDAVEAVELVLEGGRIGEYATGAPDEPQLVLDQRYLLLLVRDGADRWRVLGGPRGAVPLTRVEIPSDRLEAP